MSIIPDKILEDSNIEMAMEQVIANKGASGIDNLTIDELRNYLRKNWSDIKKQIQERTYKPQPVRRVEIPKPTGGVRKLGIPTVVDRVIQQAISQILTPIFEPTFSEYSYGFRPNRRCEQAIIKLLEYFNDGYTWIVDIDLEKFFDNVPQDRLMSLVNRTLHDGDTESLISKFLKAGVMIKEEFQETNIGTPQGGNLSPLLSNIMLNELDKELEARGLHYTRYADDVIIVVKSEAAAKRVMYSITDWIERKLGLKVNMTKTKVTKPSNLKYLGFGFYFDMKENKWKSRPYETSIQKFKSKLKHLCKRNWSVDLSHRIAKLNEVIRGWINYFSLASMKTIITKIDSHLRSMIRTIIWKQWKTPRKRQWGLMKLGINKDMARLTAYCGDRYQFVGTKTCVNKAISKEKLTRKGLVSCLDYYLKQHALKLN
jgi:group II intron reverse transcriptase/maturase